MKVTTQNTLLFRQNINRSNEDWARFLENYRSDLISFLQNEFDDDWHTAEDIVSEVFYTIITTPLITNLRPQDSFRHTLITLCKHKHSSVTKPWRKPLMIKAHDFIKNHRNAPANAYENAQLGFMMIVVRDLQDASRDGTRSYLTYSAADLTRWRHWVEDMEWGHGKKSANALSVSESTISKSCKKVNDYIDTTIKAIMKNKGLS